MILLGQPIDKDNYVFMSIEDGKILHKSGIIPEYRDIINNGFWFKKEHIKGGEI